MVVPFLPFISLKDLLWDFLLYYSVYLLINGFILLSDLAFVVIDLYIFLL